MAKARYSVNCERLRKGKVFSGCNNYPNWEFAFGIVQWIASSIVAGRLLYEKSSRSSAATLYCRVCSSQHENENSEDSDRDENAQAAETLPKRFLSLHVHIFRGA